MTKTLKKLSPVQKKFMMRVGQGWSGLVCVQPVRSCFLCHVFFVNGKKMCNLETITFLRRNGLIYEQDGAWMATQAGKDYTKEHLLSGYTSKE